jgi:hypothetical protein
MYLKAALLLTILVSCCLLLFMEAPTWRAALLLALLVWASARLYYFMFYVIERYVDPSFRFSGIGSVLRHLLGPSASRNNPSKE